MHPFHGTIALCGIAALAGYETCDILRGRDDPFADHLFAGPSVEDAATTTVPVSTTVGDLHSTYTLYLAPDGSPAGVGWSRRGPDGILVSSSPSATVHFILEHGGHCR